MFETVDKPICPKCKKSTDVWVVDGIITDAWQNHGHNYYEWICPHDGQKNKFWIPIEGERVEEWLGQTLWNHLTGWFTIPVI